MNWADKLIYILSRIFMAQFGVRSNQNRTISNTSVTVGSWVCLYVCSTAVISEIIIDGAADAGLASVASWAPGMTIYGNITSVTLTSGVVRMYGGNVSNVTTEIENK